MTCNLNVGSIVFVAMLLFPGLSDEPYFKPGAFIPKDAEIDKSFRDHFAQYLKNLKEPSLLMVARENRSAKVFRLLWLPPNEQSYCVRIDKSPSRVTVQYTRGERNRKSGVWSIASHQTLTISPDEWRKLSEAVESTGFWNTTNRVSEIGGIADGEGFLIEGVHSGSHHVLDRHGLRSTAEQMRIYSRFMALGGEEARKIWIELHPK